METPVLEVHTRDLGQKAKYIRVQSLIPGVIYGRGRENKHFSVDYQTFRKLFIVAGENTVINLKLEGKEVPVLVHDVSYDPVTDKIDHIDFVAIDMDKEVTARVQLHMIGEAPAVKEMGGILTIHKHEIEIKCLPKDLLHSIDVDITPLIDFHHAIRIRDLNVPATVKITGSPEDTVVNVTHQRVEEEKPAETAEVGSAGAEVAPGAVPAEGAKPEGSAAASGEKAPKKAPKAA